MLDGLVGPLRAAYSSQREEFQLTALGERRSTLPLRERRDLVLEEALCYLVWGGEEDFCISCFAIGGFAPKFPGLFMDVRLPNLGEGADSGSVVSIAVKEGDSIAAGQNIIELETGKAVAGIPSPSAGKVTRIAVKAGDKVSVGQVLISLEESGAPAGAPSAPAAEAPKAPAKKAAPKAVKKAPEPEAEAEEEVEEEESDWEDSVAAKAGFPPPASPTLRRLAEDLGIDLRRVKGSEEGGRIVMADLKGYIARLKSLAGAAHRKTEAGKAPAVPQAIDFQKWGSILKKPMSPLRLTIAKRMVENKVTIPEVTQFDDADITALNELRKKWAPAYEKAGTRLTLTSFALRVVAQTLKKFLIFNSSLDEAANEIILKEYVHIGLAVDTEAGLLVPVIRNADKKSLLELSKDVAALADKARERKVSLEEMQGGTFTISNQGGIGGAHFTPIINKPEAAILGLGRGAMKAVIRDGKIEPRLMMPIAISYDHRIIDGGEAARFTVELVKGFENFSEADVKI
jgi:pyruvate dehydrogenase E2 component (dihydrolipoamide acetyltransferase)